jgi:hypothetical protein
VIFLVAKHAKKADLGLTLMTTFEKSFSRYTIHNFAMSLLLPFIRTEKQGTGQRFSTLLSKFLPVYISDRFIKL